MGSIVGGSKPKPAPPPPPPPPPAPKPTAPEDTAPQVVAERRRRRAGQSQLLQSNGTDTTSKTLLGG